MRSIKYLFTTSFIFFLTLSLHAISAELENFLPTISPENHAYGRTLTAEELRGRVILLWNIDEFIKIEHNDDDNNRWGGYNRRNNNDDEDEDDNSIKSIEKAIRKTAKGSIKDGRLCVIAICKRTDSPMADKEKISGIRKLKPYFPVYFSDAANMLFNAKGDKVCDVTNVKDLAEGDRLKETIAEAPDYLPGRIVLIKTQFHTSLANRFVIGKNIDQVLPQLHQATRGKGEKAEEAKLILEAVNEYLSNVTSKIESDLSTAPSLALRQITILSKTSPSTARKFAAPYANLSKSQEIRLMTQIRTFLTNANLGEYGSGDTGRYADDYTAKLNKLKSSQNSAIVAEATTLIEALVPYTSASIAATQKAEREANRAQREKEKEEEDNWSTGSNSKKNREPKNNVQRTTVYTIIESYITTSDVDISDLVEDLQKLDVRTTNFDTLLNSYTTFAAQGSAPAKVMKEALAAHRQAKLEELTAIMKENRILDLHNEDAKWEQYLETNYPSFQRTPPGGFAIKAIRDSEVRKIYVAYHDAIQGEPKRKESSNRNNSYGGYSNNNESNEDYEVRKIQYKISKLKSLQKYINTNSNFGKICVKHLTSMGYSSADITQQINDLNTSLKEKKKAAKDSEKARKEAERNR